MRSQPNSYLGRLPLSRTRKTSAKSARTNRLLRKSKLTKHPRQTTKMDHYETSGNDASLSDNDKPAQSDQSGFDLYDGYKADTANEQADDDSVIDISGLPDQIDDPVRMYLMQMGEIPLLSRSEEISAAKGIERTRARFRQTFLASDYLLQGAAAPLRKVRDGQLRLDRTIEVSVTNTVEKKNILKAARPEPQND